MCLVYLKNSQEACVADSESKGKGTRQRGECWSGPEDDRALWAMGRAWDLTLGVMGAGAGF